MKSSVLAPAALLMFLTGCPDDDDGDDGPSPDTGVSTDSGADSGVPDTGTDAGSDPHACLDTATPRPGYGVRGGALTDSLTVFALDALDDAPIAGARVVVEGTSRSEAATDARGCVRFSGSEVSGGAVNVHVFATNRAVDSVFGLSAAEVSIGLSPPLDGPAELFAAVSGVITNPTIVTATSATVAAAGFVGPIETFIFSFVPTQAPKQDGTGFTQDVFVVGGRPGYDSPNYRFDGLEDFHVGVFAIGGTFTTPGFGAGVFTPSHMGFLDDLALIAGAELPNQDVTLTHRLSETMTISFEDDPQANFRFATSLVVLPSGHFVRPSGMDPGAGATMAAVDVPVLDGALAGSSYGAAVHFGTPTSFRRKYARRSSTPSVDLGPLPLAPVVDITSPSRTITGSVDPGANLTAVFINIGDITYWRVLDLRGDPSLSYTFPEVPAGFEDPLVGQLDFIVQSRTQDAFDPEDFEVLALNPTISAMALRVQPVVFPDPDAPPNDLACEGDEVFSLQSEGLGGGPIAGSLFLRVFNGETDQPLGNATVSVRTAAGEIVGRTDLAGCAEADVTSGPADVHVFSEGRTYVSFYGVDASEMRVSVLRPGTSGPQVPYLATIAGPVSGLDVLGSTTSSVARAVVVEAIRGDLFTAQEPVQPQRANAPFPTNLAIVGSRESYDLADYRLDVNPYQAFGVIGIGGTINIDTGAVVRTHVALVEGQTLAEDEIRNDIEVALGQPLDQPFTITTPSSTLDKVVLGLGVLPGDLMVILGFIGPSVLPTEMIDGPSFVSDFAGAHFGAAVQFSTPTFDSLQLAIDLSDQGTNVVVAVPELPTAIAGSGRTVTAMLAPSASEDAVIFIGPQNAATWIAVIRSPASSLSVAFPDVPEGFADPISGTQSVRVEGRAFAAAFDLDDQEARTREFFRALRRLSAATNSSVSF